jgi:hypothetical protein
MFDLLPRVTRKREFMDLASVRTVRLTWSIVWFHQRVTITTWVKPQARP